MNIKFERLTEEHRKPVIDIFNYFVENSFAAYPEDKVPYEFYDMIIKMTQGYPAVALSDADAGNKVAGFAFMRPYNPIGTLARTALISYFLLPEYTRRGIGHAILAFFMEEAQKRNIDSLLAEISSLNIPSIHFHEKSGFNVCGRFERVGRKHGKNFDIIWMQKLL